MSRECIISFDHGHQFRNGRCLWCNQADPNPQPLEVPRVLTEHQPPEKRITLSDAEIRDALYAYLMATERLRETEVLIEVVICAPIERHQPFLAVTVREDPLLTQRSETKWK